MMGSILFQLNVSLNSFKDDVDDFDNNVNNGDGVKNNKKI